MTPTATPIQAIVAWAVSFMVSVAPPAIHKGEPAAEVEARYAAIAEGAVRASFDSAYPPVVWGNRAASVILALSVARDESWYRKEVFLGTGRGRGDHGRSVCVMQVQVEGDSVQIGEHQWTKEDLVTDPYKCMAAAFRKLRGSFGECSSLPLRDRLSAYHTGGCYEEDARSHTRIDRAGMWLRDHRPPVADARVLAFLVEPDREEPQASLLPPR